jgi:hypothetical protein
LSLRVFSFSPRFSGFVPVAPGLSLRVFIDPDFAMDSGNTPRPEIEEKGAFFSTPGLVWVKIKMLRGLNFNGFQ